MTPTPASRLPRLAARTEELIGGVSEYVARLGTVWPVPVELADEAAALHAELSALQPRLVSFRRSLPALRPHGTPPPTRAA